GARGVGPLGARRVRAADQSGSQSAAHDHGARHAARRTHRLSARPPPREGEPPRRQEAKDWGLKDPARQSSTAVGGRKTSPIPPWRLGVLGGSPTLALALPTRLLTLAPFASRSVRHVDGAGAAARRRAVALLAELRLDAPVAAVRREDARRRADPGAVGRRGGDV